jgi:hypothetical protein
VAAVAGEQKAVTSDRFRAEGSSGEPGSIDPGAGENSQRGAERRNARRFCPQCSMPCMPVESQAGNQVTCFDPTPAVNNIVASPLYVPASWPGGFFGQFVDSMQRAAFWNLMDRDHEWHMQMDRPRVLAPMTSK